MVRLWLIPAVLVLVLTATFFFREDHPRADFVYVNTSGIHTLDPARMSWTPDFRVALNIWDGLTSWDPRDNSVMGAAAEFPPERSDDGTTYRFTIRDDARWSNGDPVTSRDFVRGWRRAIEPGSAADYSFLLTDHIAGARAYVDWRQEGVIALTALDRLCTGKPLTPTQEEMIDASPDLSRLFGRRRDQDQFEEAIGGGDTGSPHNVQVSDDWCALRHDYFETHVSELEARFRQVGLETPDDRTLVVHLTTPAPFFLDLTGLPVFLPCHESIEALRLREGADPITRQGLVIYDPQWTKPDYHAFGYPGLVTNGPYKIEQWTFRRRLRLGVNPYHWRAEGLKCRSVEMRVYDNINAAMMAYESGDVDFLPSLAVPFDHEINRLAHSGERPDFRICHAWSTYFLMFNCADVEVDGAANPFVDPIIRRAFAMAIDKPLLVEHVLARGDRVARSFVPSDVLPQYDSPLASGQDVERARQLLAEGGHPGGVGIPPIEILCTQRDVRLMQALAEQWRRALGVAVTLRSLETKTYGDRRTSRRFTVSTGSWYGDYFDPTTFLDWLATGNGNNDAGYSSREYDGLLALAAATPDPQERLRTLARAETLVVIQEVPLVPLFHLAEPIAIAPRVSGLYPNARLWFPFHLVDVKP